MSWYYPETRPRRVPLTTPVRPAASGGGGGPPTGAAGGDLAGTYPNPTLAPGAVGTTDVVDGAITDAKITSVAYAKVTGAPAIPTTLPPSGPAGGDLSGTYPNPQLGAGVVVNADINATAAIQGTKLADAPNGVPTAKLNDGAVTDAKINDVGATKLTGTIAQARLPVAPSGLLTANVNDAQITDAKIVGMAYGKLTGAPTSLPPSGAASGDLTGTYPGPTVAAATISAPKLSPAPVAGDVGKMVTVGAGPALTYTVVPTALPPSGAAGGDLAGTYPAPTIGALKVVTGSLAAGAVTDAKVNDVAWGKITGAPSSFPPSGTAGGDLTGTYPNPTIGPLKVTTGSIAALAVTDAKINDVAYSKVTGHPSSYPPSGAASGDLGGTYPGPTLAKINGAAVGTTTPLARGDILVANATPALVRLARGTVNQVLQSDGTDVVWGPAPATGGPPTGTAGGSLTGSYPNPTLAASGVTAGTYGTQYKVAQVTVTAEGRVTAVVEVTVRARWG